MASAVAPKVADVPKPVFLMDIVASASDLFNTGGAAPHSSPDGVKDSTGKGAAAADPRPERDIPIPKLFTIREDRFPEAAMRDLLLALAEDGGAASSMTGFSSHGCWVSKADGDTVQLKVAMPGLGKEHVKMRVVRDALVIKGEEGDDKDSEGDDDKGPARYSYRIELPSSQAFKVDQIKAEMKNGVLSVTLPKLKDEERKDVFEIKVE